MRTGDALTWAGIYLGLWLLVTAASVGVVAGGLALDGLELLGLGAYTPDAFAGGTESPGAGFVLLLLGVLLWKFGTAFAFFRVAVTAIERQTSAALDTEAMKSDILAVLDDRLSDMHQDLGQTKRLVERMSRDEAAEEHEFEGFEDFE